MSEDKKSIIKQPITLAVIVATLGVAALGWFLSPTSEVEEPPVAIIEPVPIVPVVPEVVEVIEVEPEPVAPEEITPVIVEPPITADTADEEARRVVDNLNAGKPAAQFVAGDYVVERAVALADHLRRGEVPYTLIPVSRPKQPFKILDDGLRVTIHPDSFERYDPFAQWIDGIDAEALVATYRKFSTVAAGALSAMGVTDVSINEVALAAVTEVISVPNVDLSAELMKQEANWVYVDPELEAMPALHKQIVRMGPINMELVQSKAREIRGALLDAN
ncbi:MAG: hypothetical protein CBB81_06670 [Cellvibrionales bacterium TMED21]|jgi:hypothetical protein|nr:hypothetical protein [Halieaceae bacterium]OUT65397.1 MAG: hypothetical protein CBB81_06670 [Cellvibrionales bacterium TMED21]